MAKWWKLLDENESLPATDRTFRIYVIEVESVVHGQGIDFYVGSTAKDDVEDRFRQDQSWDMARNTARIFLAKEGQQPKARAVRLRPDLMLDAPAFRDRPIACLAEGLLAHLLQTHGYITYSDRA
jgi:hypothetical protein